MKKLLVILLSMATIFSLVGCNINSGNNKDNPNTPSQNTSIYVDQTEFDHIFDEHEYSEEDFSYEDLANPEALKDKIKTIGDALAFIKSQKPVEKRNHGCIQFSSKEIHYQSGYNQISDSYAIGENDTFIGYKSSSAVAAYLLKDNFDEVGIVYDSFTSWGFNGVATYIKMNNKYYVINFSNYLNAPETIVPCLNSIIVDSLDEITLEKVKSKALGLNLTSIGFSDNLNQDIYFSVSDEDSCINEERTQCFKTCYAIGYPLSAPKINQAFIDKYNFDEKFGNLTLSDNDINNLSNMSLNELQEKIQTIPDMFAYLYACGYERSEDTDIQGLYENHYWHFNYAAESQVDVKSTSCGAIASIVRYLLDGDYDEVGYVNHALSAGNGGGHVYNYVVIDGEYYFFDLKSFVDNQYRTNINCYVKVGEDYTNYENIVGNLYNYANMNSNTIKLVWMYDDLRETPVEWNDDMTTSTLPSSFENDVKVVFAKEGYSINYINVSSSAQRKIDLDRGLVDYSYNELKSFVNKFNFPAVFGEFTLSESSVSSFKDMSIEEIQEEVKTIPDVLGYLRYFNYPLRDTNDTQGQYGDNYWHFNNTGELEHKLRGSSCGAIASIVRYLLDGDYDEVGYVNQTLSAGNGGGHVYNYVVIDGEYYFFDFKCYIDNRYNPRITFYVNVGDDYTDYENVVGQLYDFYQMNEDTIMIVFIYNNLREAPVSWNANMTKTSVPGYYEEDVKIVFAKPGYSLDFINISDDDLRMINKDRGLTE